MDINLFYCNTVDHIIFLLSKTVDLKEMQVTPDASARTTYVTNTYVCQTNYMYILYVLLLLACVSTNIIARFNFALYFISNNYVPVKISFKSLSPSVVC